MKQTEVYIKSTIDGTMQPSLLYKSESEQRPLIVGLHTWSYDRFNQVEYMVSYAEEYDFNLILPEFRGPNLSSNPQCTLACGSLPAKQDIIDAAEFAVNECSADKDNVYLLGGSGGGHMALLIAGYRPDYFKAIGSFVPITELSRWVDENPEYTEHIIACCSNDSREMAFRSPMSYIDNIAKSNTKIFHGKYDPSVPFMHSVRLYNEILAKHPDASVYLDIFDGGHEMNMQVAMDWVMSQYKKAKTQSLTK